ncbi:MAG: hypothetical protein Q4F67_06440, partial [Propionibacteriaceae bacterium]|nr:hypothetical protein [Propionibacteriaceae bacterium]
MNHHVLQLPPPATRSRRRRTRASSQRVLEWLIWAMIAASVISSLLSLVVNGRPEALGEVVADNTSGAVRALGLLPVAAIAALAAAVFIRARHLPITRVAALHAAIIGWALTTTALHGNLGAIGLSTIVAAIGGVFATVLAGDTEVSPARLVIVPFGIICLASLALLVVLPDLAAYDVSRTSVSLLTGRLAGVLDHPNQLGTISGLLIALVAAVRPRLGWLWGLAGAACLFLCESRTAWAATVAVVAVLVVARATRTGVRQLVVGATALTLALVASL